MLSTADNETVYELKFLGSVKKSGRTKTKRPSVLGHWAFSIGLAVTYFRMRMHTIIGANPFHGPVRDGKAWFQAAMAAR